MTDRAPAAQPPQPPTPAAGDPGGPEVLWTRPVDHARQRRRTRWFLALYVLPVAVVAVAIAVLADPFEALGFLILFGGLGLLVGGWILITGLNERASDRIVRTGGELRIGRIVVPIAEVGSFRLTMSQVRGPAIRVGASSSTISSSVSLGVARFELRGGGHRQVGWPSMDATQLAQVQDVLDAVLPGLRAADPA